MTIPPRQMKILSRILSVSGVTGDAATASDLSALHVAGLVTCHAICRLDADGSLTPLWVYRVSARGHQALEASEKAVQK